MYCENQKCEKCVCWIVGSSEFHYVILYILNKIIQTDFIYVVYKKIKKNKKIKIKIKKEEEEEEEVVVIFF
jgi:uncharacterized ion transporter superfamily protein YfcC